MADFRVVEGSFTVTPSKPSYAPGEDVKLNIKCTIERKNGVGAVFAWSTDYKVYNKSDKLLAEVSRQHSCAPWTDVDTAADDFSINLGKFSPGTLAGYVEPNAHG